MRGVAGAIDHVNWENGSWKVHVIGDREASTAEGICGSGVIDGVAGLLESGLLEDTGYLEEDVCFAGNVGLTAEDIREVQLAKGERSGQEWKHFWRRKKMLPGWKACMWQVALAPICRPKARKESDFFSQN